MSCAHALPFKCSAVISDVDGTLVTEDKILTSRAQAAVAALRASGIRFSITSARPPRMLIEPLGITTSVIGFNGGVVATTNFSIITEHLLSPEIARCAVDLLDAHQVQIWVFSGQDWFVRNSGGPYVGKEERAVGFRPTMVEDFGCNLNAAAKIVGVGKDFDLLARCDREVRTSPSSGANIVRSQKYYLDFTHPLANKGHALTELTRLMSMPSANTAVLGDGENDVDMFAQAGQSIAMGNAEVEVKDAADFVTASNDDDGLAVAVEWFVVGGKRAPIGTATTPREVA